MPEVIERPVPGEAKPKKKNNRKKRIGRIIGAVVALAVLGGIAYGLYALFHEDEGEQEIMRGFVQRGSIESTVTGTGIALPQDSKTITLSASGHVTEVYVSEGDYVNEGDPLYVIDSEDARKNVDTAKDTLENYQKQLKAIYDSYNDLVVKAPFAGKLLEVADIQVGDDVGGGRIARLVDDKTLKLELYFSYAYETEITVGKSAEVSVPATMSILTGTVDKVNFVNRITPEGSQLFAAVITIANPGTLSADMGATATLTTASGEQILPYEPGTLTYNRSTDINAKTSGKAVAVDLLNYNDVAAGQVLLRLTREDDDEERIASLNNSIRDAEKTLEKAQKTLDDFNAVAPMSGTVQSCSLKVGDDVESGKVAISIANTDVMTVQAQIDSMNVSNVKPDMYCDIVQWGRNGEMHYGGIVESVSLEAKNENGYSYFPATILVENPDGSLMSGMSVDYNMVAAQSEDCLIVPVQAVRNTAEGETCLLVETDEIPDNALDPETTGLDIPAGFVPVAVTIGLSDNFNAEIISGAEEGMTVFTQYMSAGGSSYGGMYW
jgi:multidrug resistance efflux pump